MDMKIFDLFFLPAALLTTLLISARQPAGAGDQPSAQSGGTRLDVKGP